MINPQRHKRSFYAHDIAGNRYRIEVWVDILYDHRGEEEEGVKSLRCQGKPVNRKRKGLYYFFDRPDLELTCDDDNESE